MIYKELINELKKVKKPEDINEDLLEMMASATLDAHVEFYLQDDDTMPQEAIEMTRIGILKEIDFMLLDLHQMLMEGGLPNVPDLSNSPMGDEILKKQLEKAFQDYNKRIEG